MQKDYTMYSDPAHGWLAVPWEDARELGIFRDITCFSYVSRDLKTLYLEEDCDASLFMDAYKDKFGSYPKIGEHYTDDREKIRSYPSVANVNFSKVNIVGVR